MLSSRSHRWAASCFAALGLAGAAVAAQTSDGAPERGLRRVDPQWHALQHAQVVTRPGVVVEDATVVMRDGRIVSVEAGGAVPEGARVHDCTGLVVHAGFVEPHLAVDAPFAPSETSTDHWHHQLITPQRSALDGAGVDPATAQELRALGFAAAAIAPRAGIFRGTASVVALGDAGDDLSSANDGVIAEDVLQVMGFDRGGFGASGELGYPNSEMGAIALARQTLMDAAHYAQCLAVHAAAPQSRALPAPSRALAALGRPTPLLFDARSELQVLRAAKIAAEFGRPMIVIGSGDEYRRIDAVRATGLPILVPLNFADAPDVSTIAKADALSLRDLMAWEQAPTNLRRLREAGVEVALTTARLDSLGDFPARLRRALEWGVSDEDALAMLTTIPAELLGLGDQLGRVEAGQYANLVVTDGPLFQESTKVRDVWVLGRRHVVEAAPGPDRTGTWSVVFERLGEREKVPAELVLEKGDKARFVLADADAAAEGAGGEAATPGPDAGAAKTEAGAEATSEAAHAADATDGDEAQSKQAKGSLEARDVRVGRYDLHFHVDGQRLGLAGVVSASGLFERAGLPGGAARPEGEVLHGRLVAGDGQVVRWSATRKPAEVTAADDGAEAKPASPAPAALAPLGLPFGAFAEVGGLPAQRDVRVEGATLWTSAPAGVVADGVLVITAGRIVYAGPRAGAPATPNHTLVDAEGKHVTPGLIDCHSHTGVSGSVNEGGQRVTCEVRIADVIDPDDVAFYHQLAGGLTAANQLHGSANAIGGQNSVVKLRWGVSHPDDMRVEGAPAGVKFALGENPKRVAAGTDRSDEYPQTRLGVEALIRDRLNAGRHYNEEWARYRALSDWERRTTVPPRRDLELEALGEIVSGTRWIHCHSYRQDEILMLARIAQEYGIQIGTFQHVLEGYKVAEAVKASARGASSFADWWAYKFEVVDAIPDSPAIMHEVGVVVSINSDSDEFARRLNTEAAKGMKYGGMSPHDALCMVTVNPALQLGIADRVGSLEPGKDADFVIWSGDPLSYYSRCEATWIDGREYYSLARDAELRASAESERQRLIQALLTEGKAERKPGAGGSRRRGAERLAAGELSLREAYELGLYAEIEALWRGGSDPGSSQPGVCGCWDVFLGDADLDALFGSAEVLGQDTTTEGTR
ncbi:MAG: amidohydrolase family protein [Planctomycetota bacterium]